MKNIRIRLITVILSFICFILISPTYTADAKTNGNTVGNSSGNISNGGIVAEQGIWIYYRNPSDAGKLYKIKKDNTEKKKLNNDDSWCINVVDNWIYYKNAKDNYIYKVSTNGTNRVNIYNREVDKFIVYKDYIYLDLYKGGLYRIDINGKNECILNDANGVMYLGIVNDTLYYSSTELGYGYVPHYNAFTEEFDLDYEVIVHSLFYKMTLNDFKEKLIYDDATDNLCICIDNDSLYSITAFNNKIAVKKQGVCCITSLNDDQDIVLRNYNQTLYNNFNIYDGKAYFSYVKDRNDSIDQMAFGTCDTESLTKDNDDFINSITDLYIGKVSSINVIEGWIFYRNEDDGNYYKMNADGSRNEKIS